MEEEDEQNEEEEEDEGRSLQTEIQEELHDSARGGGTYLSLSLSVCPFCLN